MKEDYVQSSTIESLVTYAGMTSLCNMRLQDIAIFMFKMRNRLLPYNILDLFSPSLQPGELGLSCSKGKNC